MENRTTDYIDYEHIFEAVNSNPELSADGSSLQVQEQFSFMFAVGMALGYILYGVAIIFGIPCNVFVLYRMYKFAKVCPEVFSNGTGVCLFAMGVADIISLVSICVHYVLSFGILELNDLLHANICKFVIFATHVSTSVSIWSWLLMSTLRYLSVYYPLVYISLWRLPLRVLAITFGGAFATNLWLLSVVTYVPTELGPNGEVIAAGGCVQMPLYSELPDLNRIFLFIEIFWSFIVPTLTIIFVDSSVYLCRYSLIRKTRELEHDLRKNNACPIQKKTHRTLWKWLIIALIDVGLNTPENINRLAVILGIVSDTSDSTESYLLIRVFSQLLYYLQFSFNGVYLALFIYDKSTTISSNNQSGKKRKRKSLRQPSIIKTTPDVHQKLRPSLASPVASPSDEEEGELSQKYPYHLVHKVAALKSPTKIISAFEAV